MTMAARGLAKLSEELGELQQVIGKRLAYYTTDRHPDGGPALSMRMEDEMGDVLAAMSFVQTTWALDHVRIAERANRKLALFQEWEAQVDNNLDGVDA